MRIALVHSFYANGEASGENATVNDQAAALRRQGHEVHVFGRSWENVGVSRALRTATRVATGHGVSPLGELEAYGPDVVHVHNLFPNWSTAWMRQCKFPLVATLHNFRTACIAGTHLRDGHECRLCVQGSTWNGVRFACYRGSAAASIPAAVANRGPVAAHPLIAHSDKLVALSPRSAAVHMRNGVPASKLQVIPNFVPDPGVVRQEPSTAWAFVGRLAPEKGIMELARAWPAGIELDVYGDGPLRTELAGLGHPDIRIHGMVPRQQVAASLARARGLVFPSLWPEGLPLVYLEALAQGRPVVAAGGNAAADDVDASGCGATFESFDGLREALSKVEARWSAAAVAARNRFEQGYAESGWVAAMEALYEELSAQRTSQESSP